MKKKLKGRNLITFDSWENEEINAVVELAVELKKRRKQGEIINPLMNQTLFMIFFEQSTRTRNSLEAAMTQLGGHAHDLTSDKMQISHGETPRDTAKVLSQMGEAIAIRNCFYGIGNKYLCDIAANSDIPLISMQDDVYHPLQVIADLMSIREVYGNNLNGLKVAVTWAYATSHAKALSVPQSQALIFPRFGMDVVVANPPEFPLQDNILKKAGDNAGRYGGNFSVVNSMQDAVKDADIIIPKNWGGFGSFDKFSDDEKSYDIMKKNLENHKDWICDMKTYKLAGKDAKIMHALPADRNKEVTDDVLDGPNSIIYEEAGNRMHTAKSLLTLLLGGQV
jgi:ornithine carbamoyltransferase